VNDALSTTGRVHLIQPTVLLAIIAAKKERIIATKAKDAKGALQRS
jgi:hypothetical protein